MHALEEKNMLTQELEKCRKLVEELQTEKVFFYTFNLIIIFIVNVLIWFRLKY
jgi:hypothetical protein